MAPLVAREVNAPRYKGRLAPSPTGALHLGNIRTFMVAWLRARSAGGEIVLRMENLDHPHNKPGAEKGIVDDLRWLGFDWDSESVQSSNRGEYRSALEKLEKGGFVYPCTCTRADVERAQSAPHAGEQLYYPGTCRGRYASWAEAAAHCAPRVPVWRFAAGHPALERFAPSGIVEFDDGFSGRHAMNVRETLGDFPLARDEDGAGYMLASVVDDCASGVTEIVRGDDLLPATPAQMLTALALGLRFPAVFHVPLVTGRDGLRLAKRHGDSRISAFRAAGVAPEEIIGFLAFRSGFAPSPRPVALRDLVDLFDSASIPHAPLAIDSPETLF